MVQILYIHLRRQAYTARCHPCSSQQHSPHPLAPAPHSAPLALSARSCGLDTPAAQRVPSTFMLLCGRAQGLAGTCSTACSPNDPPCAVTFCQRNPWPQPSRCRAPTNLGVLPASRCWAAAVLELMLQNALATPHTLTTGQILCHLLAALVAPGSVGCVHMHTVVCLCFTCTSLKLLVVGPIPPSPKSQQPALSYVDSGLGGPVCRLRQAAGHR